MSFKGWGVFYKSNGILVTPVYGSSHLAGYGSRAEALTSLKHRGADVPDALLTEPEDMQSRLVGYGTITPPERYD